MIRSAVFTIWPANSDGIPATTEAAWRQDRYWVVLDITGGDVHVVEGPVPKEIALRRELELRARVKAQKEAHKEAAC